jgi:aryl-alcohol dehydrogenase-like predicted oxidoreductase
MSMTPIYGEPDPNEAMATIQRAPEVGIDFIDTSDAYGANGSNEELVGRAIRGRRDKYVLASKFGNIRLPDGKPGANGKPDYVMAACDASLKRLGVGVIDLYFIHRIDETVPIEDTVGAMSELVRQGKVRYLGLSEARPDTIRRADAVHKITAVQTEYSILYRAEAEETRKVTSALGISFVAYAPLGRGLLAGAIRTAADVDGRRAAHPRFQGENFEHNRRLAEKIEALAAEKGCTPAQIALAWVLAQGGDVVAIPGTRYPARLDENLGALDVVLSAEELAALDAAVPAGAAAGTRYPTGGMAGVQL